MVAQEDCRSLAPAVVLGIYAGAVLPLLLRSEGSGMTIGVMSGMRFGELPDEPRVQKKREVRPEPPDPPLAVNPELDAPKAQRELFAASANRQVLSDPGLIAGSSLADSDGESLVASLLARHPARFSPDMSSAARDSRRARMQALRQALGGKEVVADSGLAGTDHEAEGAANRRNERAAGATHRERDAEEAEGTDAGAGLELSAARETERADELGRGAEPGEGAERRTEGAEHPEVGREVRVGAVADRQADSGELPPEVREAADQALDSIVRYIASAAEQVAERRAMLRLLAETGEATEGDIAALKFLDEFVPQAQALQAALVVVAHASSVAPAVASYVWVEAGWWRIRRPRQMTRSSRRSSVR